MAISFATTAVAGTRPSIYGTPRILPGGFSLAGTHTAGDIIKAGTLVRVDFDAKTATLCTTTESTQQVGEENNKTTQVVYTDTGGTPNAVVAVDVKVPAAGKGILVVDCAFDALVIMPSDLVINPDWLTETGGFCLKGNPSIRFIKQ